MKRNTKLVTVFAVLAAASLLVYQNCGELRPSATAVSDQASYERRISDDATLMSRLLVTNPLQVRVSSKAPGASTSSVISLAGASPTSIALSATAVAPNLKAATSSVLMPNSIFEFASNAGMQTALTEAGLTSEEYSVVALLEGPLDGPIFTLDSGTANTQQLSLSYMSGVFLAMQRQGTNGTTSLAAPAQSKTNTLVVAVSFAKAANAINIQVDGFPTTSSITTVGSPNANGYLLRRLILGGAGSKMHLAEFLLFSKALNESELNYVSRYVADQWGISGLNYVPVPTGPVVPVDPNIDPNAAGIALIENNCKSCHVHGTDYASIRATLLGRSKDDIKTAIAQQARMNSIVLTDAEIASISRALQ